MMQRHLDSANHFNTFGINREPAALDAQETQFFERSRRSTANVSYPHHIPVPHSVFNVQRRGLTYQSAACQHRNLSLPVIGSARFVAGVVCPISPAKGLVHDGAAC